MLIEWLFVAFAMAAAGSEVGGAELDGYAHSEVEALLPDITTFATIRATEVAGTCVNP